jgi:hypothetical protein
VVIKLGVVPVEIVEPVGVGGSATTTGIVGTGATTTTVGVGVGANVNLDTNRVAVGAVGLVTVEPSHAAIRRANTTNALGRLIPDARATAIPRFGRHFAVAEPRPLAFQSDVTRRSG